MRGDMNDSILLQVFNVVHQHAIIVIFLHAELVDDPRQGCADPLVDEVQDAFVHGRAPVDSREHIVRNHRLVLVLVVEILPFEQVRLLSDLVSDTSDKGLYLLLQKDAFADLHITVDLVSIELLVLFGCGFFCWFLGFFEILGVSGDIGVLLDFFQDCVSNFLHEIRFRNIFTFLTLFFDKPIELGEEFLQQRV